MITKEIDIIGD